MANTSDEVRRTGAAKILGLSPAMVGVLARTGKLRFIERDGHRFFRVRDVERLAAERAGIQARGRQRSAPVE